MRIERFEDIEGWQQGRALTRMVYAATRKPRFAHDLGPKDQTQRACVSVMLNVAEGFDSGSNAEFVKLLGYAQRPCTDVQSALYVALDQEYVSESEFAALYEQAQATRAVIGGFIKYLLTHERRDSAARSKVDGASQEPRTTNYELRTTN